MRRLVAEIRRLTGGTRIASLIALSNDKSPASREKAKSAAKRRRFDGKTHVLPAAPEGWRRFSGNERSIA